MRSLPPRFACVAVAAALLLGAEAPIPGIRFVERARSAGIQFETVNGNPARNYIIETLGSGAAMLDYDLDGDLDLYVVNGSRLDPSEPGKEPLPRLYRNDGKGLFADVTAASGLQAPFWGFGAATGDYDNDGDPDLYVTAWGPDHLYRNDGGTFTDVSSQALVRDDRLGSSAAFVDYDNDGALDLFVANYVTFDPTKVPKKGDTGSPCNFRGLTVMCGPHGLQGAVDFLYHNNGDGTFSDVAAAAGLYMGGTYYGLGIVTGDFDGDGRVDILVANDSTPNHFYRNLGDGKFSDDALIAGFAYSNDGREQAGMGIDAADIDSDGDLDVFVTNFSHDYDTLRLNDGKGYLEDVSVRLGLVEPTIRTLGWGTLLFDIENDGDIDIFLANGHVYPEVEEADIGTEYRQRNQIFENLGGLKLAETFPVPGGSLGNVDLHRSVAGGDIDGDGDIDLFVTVLNGQPELLVNESARGSWLGVRLVGRASNRDGVGARLVVRAGGRTWMAERAGGRSYLAASDPRVHFGLGAVRRIDSVDVVWPSGIKQSIVAPPMDAVLTIEEPERPAANSASAKTEPS